MPVGTGGFAARGDEDSRGWTGGSRGGVEDFEADGAMENVELPYHRSAGRSGNVHGGDGSGKASTADIEDAGPKAPNTSLLSAFGSGGADTEPSEPATSCVAASYQGFGRPNSVLHEARTRPERKQTD